MFRSCGLLALLLALSGAPAFGSGDALEWQVEKTLPLTEHPLDLAATSDGKQLYTLLAKGRVVVYSNEGEKQHQLEVDPLADKIEIGPTGDRLYVMSQKNKTLQIIKIDFAFDIETLGSPSRGPADAPVEIVVFSDFQCPYCAKLVPTLEQVSALYPEQVRVVFKNYPLQNHAFARQAAFAALAANDQDQFWPIHDALFANYNQLNDAKISEIAETLGLDRELFNKGRKSQKNWSRISQDIEEAKRVGVRGTPTVFVAGKRLNDRSLEGFRTRIDEALVKQLPDQGSRRGE